MIQICTEDYWQHMESIRDRTEGAPCGRTFDDASRSTLCPHASLPAPGFTYSADGAIR